MEVGDLGLWISCTSTIIAIGTLRQVAGEAFPPDRSSASAFLPSPRCLSTCEVGWGFLPIGEERGSSTVTRIRLRHSNLVDLMVAIDLIHASIQPKSVPVDSSQH